MRTLMLVFAHPDDESFGPGGTAARCADAGVRVVLVCATLGEAGKVGHPPVCRPEELPAVRRQELLAAARVLGIAEVELLGYPDRGCAEVPAGQAVERLLGLLLRHRPEVVVTFPPGGISGHPDHLAVRAWTEAAVREAAAQGLSARLYYYTVPALPQLTGEQPRHPLDACYHVRIDVRPWLPRKLAAIRCHRTQHLSAERILGRWRAGSEDSPWGFEHFFQAWPPAGPDADRGGPVRDDVFDPPLRPGPAAEPRTAACGG